MAHVDAAPVRAAQGLPGGAQDDRDMGDRERSGAIVEGGLVTKKWISDPITQPPANHRQLARGGGVVTHVTSPADHRPSPQAPYRRHYTLLHTRTCHLGLLPPSPRAPRHRRPTPRAVHLRPPPVRPAAPLLAPRAH